MDLTIKLISTDFDGTLFAEFENPPIPQELEQLIGQLQARGAKWVINTGRDMSSLMEALARAGIAIEPDFLVLDEREIHLHRDSQYIALEEWNQPCHLAHSELFARVHADVPAIVAWINARFHAKIYEDAYSPLFPAIRQNRSEEHTSELQSLAYLVCRLLLEKKKYIERTSSRAS